MINNQELAQSALRYAEARLAWMRMGGRDERTDRQEAYIARSANELIQRACAARRAALNSAAFFGSGDPAFAANNAEYVAIMEWEESLK